MNINNQSKKLFDIQWMQKNVKCWVYQPQNNSNQIYFKAIIKNIVPQSLNKSNSRVQVLLQKGGQYQTRACNIERCRQSNSIQRDLIQMDIINPPQVLLQLKKKLSLHQIHTYLWNSLIIVNPFKKINQLYSPNNLHQHYENIVLKKEDIRKHQPHVFSFIFEIVSQLSTTTKIQVINISGQSGSGKTQTNKQALRAITYCQIQNNKLSQNTILKCDPILQVFGNAKTVKNDNSSRFGKLISLKINCFSLKIVNSSLKSYFLQKSRIISQSNGQRNFHIFYQLLSYLPEQVRSNLRLKYKQGGLMRPQNFRYLAKIGSNKSYVEGDKQMWNQLNASLVSLNFNPNLIHQIWSIIACILLLGNIQFQFQKDTQVCQVKNNQYAESVGHLLGINTKQLIDAFICQKRVISQQTITSYLNQKQCNEGRDSISKAMYQSLFVWIVDELNKRVNKQQNNQQQTKTVKLLDIYGFQVFDHNSFQQLCVNYTNQKIHQIYLEQVFIQQKSVLRKQGLQSIINKLDFTDNIKIIQLIQSLNKSIFNLLDQSCSVNVKDDQFLASIKKNHQRHQKFPQSNNINTKKTFIIRHTPCDIQYVVDGFRDKNKDLIRQDLLKRLTTTKSGILKNAFQNRLQLLRIEGNKKYLGIKIRKQVKQLIHQMSTNTDLHFIRCIKPNQKKQPFLFDQKVSYNQIKYLGILDTIQMRKDSYHIRMHYKQFYQKYGVLENRIDTMIALEEGRLSNQQCKQITIKLVNDILVKYNLDYQFGKQRIFLKISTQNMFQNLLKNKLSYLKFASNRLIAQMRMIRVKQRRQDNRTKLPKIQKAIKQYLKNVRIIKKKKAVKLIQAAWIKYYKVFFNKKHYYKLRQLQKYIKQHVQKSKRQEKVAAIRRAKQLIRSITNSNKYIRAIQNHKTVKEIVNEFIVQQFWKRQFKLKIQMIKKYLKNGLFLIQNINSITKIQYYTNYRLNIKYHNIIQRYFHGGQSLINYNRRKQAIVKIQTILKMLRYRNKFISLKKNVLIIQRGWRNYIQHKKYNIKFTQQCFKQGVYGYLDQQTNHWNQILFRNLYKSGQTKGIQNILQKNNRIRLDKISLFYYLLDFQILSDLGFIYPQSSWINNYFSIYQQSWQKGNPIQYVSVSDQHTIVSTVSRAYTWGNIKLEDMMPQNKSKVKWKVIQTLPAHNGYSVIQTEKQQPQIFGKRLLYHEDGSSKQWRTLNESYIIINGIILTLQKIQLTKLVIPDKVVQLSCGMAHCIAKTSLRKVYVWGSNKNGQLGTNCFRKQTKPKLLQFVWKNALIIQQVASSAYCTMMMDSNSRLWWWGSNGTIKNICSPKQAQIFQKSDFLDNPNKYSMIRIIPSWSRSISLIGVTIAAHEGIFKSSQNNIRRKIYQNLMNKWNDKITTVSPPFVQSISGYFQQKLMVKPKIQNSSKNSREIQHQKIRQKLLAQITLMQQAQRNLISNKKKY